MSEYIIGDRVLVTKQLSKYIHHFQWDIEMHRAIGRRAIITDFDSIAARAFVKLKFLLSDIEEICGSYFYPVGALMRANPTWVPFSVTDLVLVTNNFNGNKTIWSLCKFIEYDSSKKKFKVISPEEKDKFMEFKYCIRYKGNEHLANHQT